MRERRPPGVLVHVAGVGQPYVPLETLGHGGDELGVPAIHVLGLQVAEGDQDLLERQHLGSLDVRVDADRPGEGRWRRDRRRCGGRRGTRGRDQEPRRVGLRRNGRVRWLVLPAVDQQYRQGRPDLGVAGGEVADPSVERWDPTGRPAGRVRQRDLFEGEEVLGRHVQADPGRHVTDRGRGAVGRGRQREPDSSLETGRRPAGRSEQSAQQRVELHAAVEDQLEPPPVDRRGDRPLAEHRPSEIVEQRRRHEVGALVAADDQLGVHDAGRLGDVAAQPLDQFRVEPGHELEPDPHR